MILKILNVISYVTVLCTIIFVGYVGYMLGYNTANPPATIKTIYSDPEVKRGGKFTVLNEVDRIRDCRVISSREVTNVDTMRVYELDPVDRDIQKTNKVVVREVVLDVPSHFVPGNYTYQSVLHYYCNISNHILGPTIIRTSLVNFKVTE